MKNRSKGPQFLRYINPIIQALKELGGSGNSAEVVDLVIKNQKISEEEADERLVSGESRIRNQIAWGRLYLVKSGFLDSSKRGVWSLTEKGFNSNLSSEDIYKLSKVVKDQFRPETVSKPSEIATYQITVNENEPFPEEIQSNNLKDRLLHILQELPPSGFERICQRLLRESGFQQVIVTGKSGDGGIDGHGLLEINPFVSLKVIFQCKRYKGSVTPSQVRDFRGAMMGRADKGIILTTGRFTRDAREEAIRDGVPPIELIDGEKLVAMFEKLELGMKPKTI